MFIKELIEEGNLEKVDKWTYKILKKELSLADMIWWPFLIVLSFAFFSLLQIINYFVQKINVNLKIILACSDQLETKLN